MLSKQINPNDAEYIRSLATNVKELTEKHGSKITDCSSSILMEYGYPHEFDVFDADQLNEILEMNFLKLPNNIGITINLNENHGLDFDLIMIDYDFNGTFQVDLGLDNAVEFNSIYDLMGNLELAISGKYCEILKEPDLQTHKIGTDGVIALRGFQFVKELITEKFKGKITNIQTTLGSGADDSCSASMKKHIITENLIPLNLTNENINKLSRMEFLHIPYEIEATFEFDNGFAINMTYNFYDLTYAVRHGSYYDVMTTDHESKREFEDVHYFKKHVENEVNNYDNYVETEV